MIAPASRAVRPAGPPRARLAAVIVVSLAVAAGCAHPQPARPAPAVAAEVARAEAALARRDHLVARAAYERAVALATDQPSELYARKELAEALVLWRDLPAAVEQLARLTALAPDDPATWHDLGIVRHTLGDDDGARVALERARDLRPRDPRPRLALAALAWSRHDRAAALAEYRALAALDLPARLRDKVDWALRELARPAP